MPLNAVLITRAEQSSLCVNTTQRLGINRYWLDAFSIRLSLRGMATQRPGSALTTRCFLQVRAQELRDGRTQAFALSKKKKVLMSETRASRIS